MLEEMVTKDPHANDHFSALSSMTKAKVFTVKILTKPDTIGTI